jgi:diguanylate cyclase (GGDEF)-like protein
MSEGRANSSKRARRNQPFLSIRARLIVLALLAIAPLMLARLHELESARLSRLNAVNAEVIDLARRGVESQRDIIYSVRALLQTVSRLYARIPLDTPDCNEYLADLSANVQWIRGLSIASTGGRINCSSEPMAIGLDLSDRPQVRNALASRQFALSDYLMDRLDHVPSLVATFPIIQDDGALKGIALAVINMEWIGELAAGAAQHSGASVLLLDSRGTVIGGSANQQSFVGKRFAGEPLTRQMLAADDGTAAIAGFDGIQRLYAYARFPWTGARLAVGLDENAVRNGIDRETAIAGLQLAACCIFVLLLAWFGGEHLVVRPIRSLVRTAARFGRGDLHARASDEPCVAEFEPLAAALDDMAAKLAAREEELRVANEHLEELASLDSLSGLANRRGFDRQLEREWQFAAEHRKPIALMMVDVDHFKLFNDRYGHVAGDTCLRAVGETLSLVTIEEAALVARYGGEEFALLLPGLTVDRAAAIAQEARKRVEDLLISHSEAPCGHVTVSIGVESMVPEKSQTAADLVEAADDALSAAKRRGRNIVVARMPAPLRAVS